MYLLWFKKVFRGVLLVAFSPFLVLWALGDRHGEAVEFWSFKVVNAGFELGISVRELWRVFVALVRIAGWITIVLLVATSVLTLLYLVLRENYISWPSLDAYYPVAARILENKIAWAAISTVLGAMVAMSHLLNLEINQSKFKQEQDDRWRIENEARKTREDLMLPVTRPGADSK